MTDVWQHLFLDGEFISRRRVLAGLSLRQITARPGGAPHSIYDELWHAAEWQRIVVERDDERAGVWGEGGEPFPGQEPERLDQWHELVEKYLRGAREATAWGDSLEGTGPELEPGWRAAEVLASLAVHDAYHMGKLVSLRQVLGAWPPPV